MLPLYTLSGFVPLPTLGVEVAPLYAAGVQVTGQASQRNDLLVAVQDEGEAVHEVGVWGQVVAAGESSERVMFRGLNRCRWRRLVAEAIPKVRAGNLHDTPQPFKRQKPPRRLLLRRCFKVGYEGDRRFCDGFYARNWTALTWVLTAQHRPEPGQKQRLLNPAEPVERGQVLLQALRRPGEKRGLRPFIKWLQKGGQWN